MHAGKNLNPNPSLQPVQYAEKLKNLLKLEPVRDTLTTSKNLYQLASEDCNSKMTTKVTQETILILNSTNLFWEP